MSDLLNDQYDSSDDSSSDDDLEVVIDHRNEESDSSDEDETNEAGVDEPEVINDEAAENPRIVVTPPHSDGEGHEEEEQVESAQDNSNEVNNNDQDKQFLSWEGQRLYPPNQRKVSNPSKVWEFGGLRKVNGKLDTSVAVCALCGKVNVYKGSPGNFQTHLKIVHKQEYEGEVNSNSSQLKITDFSLLTGSISSKY